MSLAEINDIKGRSEAGKKGYGPWSTDFNEMAKKTIIKRESKTWPKTDKSERFDTAVQVINEHEGIEFQSISGEGIDLQSLEDTYIEIVQIITADSDEDAAYSRVQELYNLLNNDEQIQLNDKLRKYKPDGSRQYNTLLKDYLSYQPASIEGELAN